MTQNNHDSQNASSLANTTPKRSFIRLNVGLALLAFGALLVSAIVFFMVRLGYFREMQTQEVTLAARPLLYKPHTGPYHTIGAAITEVETWAKANAIGCEQTFGEYLDDPRKVEEARLRANGGCVLSDATNLADLELSKPKDMVLGQMPAGEYFQILFTGSPAIGPWKIYPFAMGYFQDKKWTFPDRTFEVYTVHSADEMTTEYLFERRLAGR